VIVIISVNIRRNPYFNGLSPNGEAFIKLGRLAKEYSDASAAIKQLSPAFNEDEQNEVPAEELASQIFDLKWGKTSKMSSLPFEIL
jgi:hypothetical protein